jgi:hypothetical protein
MLKCDKHEALIMRYFDGDLDGQERKELDQHLDSCPTCRLLSSQLSGILETLENAKPPEPEPHLERLVMDRIMSLTVQPNINEQYRSVRLIYGTSAGIAALLLWATSLIIQDGDLMDLILAGRNYLDLLAGFILDLQIAYQIAAGLFPSEIVSLFFRIQFVFVLATFTVIFVVARTAFGRSTGEYRDVS